MDSHLERTMMGCYIFSLTITSISSTTIQPPGDLASEVVDFVELEYSELDLLLAFNLLGLHVGLLLALLSAATEAKNEVESGLLLNVVIRESVVVLELLPGKRLGIAGLDTTKIYSDLEFAEQRREVKREYPSRRAVSLI